MRWSCADSSISRQVTDPLLKVFILLILFRQTGNQSGPSGRALCAADQRLHLPPCHAWNEGLTSLTRKSSDGN